jgi:hypothetical protein
MVGPWLAFNVGQINGKPANRSKKRINLGVKLNYIIGLIQLKCCLLVVTGTT